METAKVKSVMIVETGKVFGSVAEAAESVGCKKNSIYTAIRKGERLKGFHWTYADAPADGNGDAPSASDFKGEDVLETDSASALDMTALLLSQLETKDTQIAELQATTRALTSQLAAKDRQLAAKEKKIDSLDSKLHQIKADEQVHRTTESYWQKKVDECEMELRKERAEKERILSERETDAKSPSALEKLKRLLG